MKFLRICRKTLIYSAEILAGLLVAVALAGGFVGYKIYHGGLNTSYFNSYIMESFLGVGDVEAVAARSRVFWDHDIDTMVLEVRDLTVASGGRRMLELDEIYVRFAAEKLLYLSLAPTIVKIRHPVVYVPRAQRAQEAQAVPNDEEGGQSALLARYIISPIYHLQRSDELESLESLEISNIRVEYDRTDAEQTPLPLIRQANVVFYRFENTLSGQYAADLSVGGQETSLDGEITYDLTRNEFSLISKFDELSAWQIDQFRPGILKSFPVQGKFSGFFSSRFAITGYRSHISNDLALEIRGIQFGLKSPAGTIDLKPASTQALAYKDIDLVISYKDRSQEFRIDKLSMDMGAFRLEARGEVTPQNGTPVLALNVVLSEISIADALKIWPADLAEKPRAWATQHLKAGTAEVSADIRAVFGAEALELAGVEGRGTFTQARATYFRDFPQIEDVTGRLAFTDKTFDVWVDNGTLSGTQVSEGHLKFYNFDRDPAVIDIAFHADGDVSQLLRILDRDPIFVSKKFPYALDTLQGRGKVEVMITALPLVDEDIPEEQFNIKATGILENLQSPSFAFDMPLDKAQLFMDLSISQLNLRGPMTLNGIDFNLEYSQIFNGNILNYQLTGNLDQAGREKLGLGKEVELTGNIPFTAAIKQTGERYEGNISLDLTPVKVGENVTNWSKAAGAKASVKADLVYSEQAGIDLRSLTATGPDLELTATGKLTSSGALREINVPLSRIGKTQIAASGKSQGDNMTLSLSGPYLDASQSDRWPDDDKKDGKGKISVTARFDQVDMGGKDTLRSVNLGFVQDRKTGRYDRMDLIAFTPDSKQINAAIFAEQDGIRQLLINTDAAGEALRALDIYQNMYGGQLRIDGIFDDSLDPSELQGSIEIRNFRVVRAPTLARIMNVIFLTGVLDMLQGEGINFTKLEGSYTYKDELLTIKKLNAEGASVGFFAVGNIDLRNDKMDIEGSVAPAYTINKFLGNVPILGTLLKGGSDEELLAARYSVRGSLDNPQTSVNPLSALTPGVFRNLFGRPGGTEFEREETPPPAPSE